MSNPSGGGSKPSTAQNPPSGSTSSDQVVVKVPVLCIRRDNTHQFRTVLSTTDGISLSTGDLHLGHVPNVQAFWKNESSWDQRHCTRIEIGQRADGGKDFKPRPHVPGIYYVMICKLKELGRHDLAKISKACIYGDAFFFKVSEEGADTNGRAVFEQVPADMISVGIARAILQKLAIGWEGGKLESW